jgi:MFS family permease
VADVSLPPEPGGAGVLRRVDAVVDAPHKAVFGLLGYVLPETSIARNFQFQYLMGAKFLADAGRDSVRYAAIVAVVYNGGSAFAAALIGLASLVPSVLFALYGGAIADSLPKRVALAAVYGIDAAICIFFPIVFGTGTGVLFLMVFLVASLTQIASPAEQTLVPLASSEEQLASANSVMGMVSSIGTAFGTAFLAPILLKTTSVNVVFYTAAVLLILAMTRILQVNVSGDVAGKKGFVKPRGNLSKAFRWLTKNPSILTMIGVSAVGGVGYAVMSTLAPIYMDEVLNTDPANTVFVLGVAGVGMTASLFVVPLFIRWSSERVVAGIGFIMLAVGLIGLGLINRGWVDFLNVINPVYWLDQLFTWRDIGDKIALAMFLSFPVGFGMGLTDNSVKTYLNRRVPIPYQGRTFAMRNLTEGALTIAPLLTVSAIATFVGVSAVLVFSPLIFYFAVITLLRISAAFGEDAEVMPEGVFRSYWEETDLAEVTSMDAEEDGPASPPAPAPGV